MALINCPECGAQISDKAPACIHCGFPLPEKEVEPKNKIVSLFETVLTGVKAGDIYDDVLQCVLEIKASCSKEEANDAIAMNIIDGLSIIPSKLAWTNAKQYCEMIDFSTLSNEAMNYFTDKLYSVISIKEYCNDGSSGFVNVITFFYAEYMVMHYGKPENKEQLMEVLKHPFWGKQNGYDYIVSMFKQHGSGNTMQQIASVQSSMHSMKCPVCGSGSVKRITTTNRLVSVFAFGAASSKIGKQYECKSCKHKW